MGISIFSFDATSDYLQKHIKGLPLGGRGEASKIAKHLNVSTTYISQILSGTRYMTYEQNIELSRYLGLDQRESDYFMLLISKERAGSHNLKEYFQTKLVLLKEQAAKLVHHIKPKDELKNEDKAIFYSSPTFSEVMLFTALKKEGVTLEEIKERFNLSPKRTREVINFLQSCSLVVEVKGYYKIGIQSIHLEDDSPFLVKHHTNWRLRSMQAADRLEKNELMYTVNLTLNQADFEKIKSKLIETIKEVMKISDPSPPEELACLNIDLFFNK